MTAPILVVAPDLPHRPYTGAHARPLSLMKALARRFDVVAVGAAQPEADLAELESLCAVVARLPQEPYHRGPRRALLAAARRGFTPVPLIARSRSSALAALVEESAARYRPAVVQVETMYAAHYRQPHIPAVMDLPDVVSGLCLAAAAAHPARYAAARWQRTAAERGERRLLAAFAAVLAINDNDAARLRRLGIEADTIPLAIAMPSDEEVSGRPAGDACDAPAADPERVTTPADVRPLELLFVGAYRHLPNRDAATFIATRLVPALARRGLSCHVTIAGRDAAALGAAGASSRNRGCVTVEYIADPPDLAPLYRASDVVLAPLAHGGGTKNKTLEAMAWGRCVVGTAQAFTGLPTDLRDIAFVERPLDAGAITDTLIRLTHDATLRTRLGRSGRAYVSEHHTQARVNALVDHVYERVLAEAASVAQITPSRGAPAGQTRAAHLQAPAP